MAGSLHALGLHHLHQGVRLEAAGAGFTTVTIEAMYRVVNS